MRKNWILNILLASVATAILLWFVFLWMDWYTRHNEYIDVPSVKGISYESAVEKLEEAGLRYEIFDSVYNEDFKKNAVTEQDPRAKSQVKPNRIVYLSINALARPKVKMPKLVDQSITLGKAILKNVGLKLGDVTYKFDDIGHNLVIEQLYNGAPILPGKMLEKNSTIDLIVATNRQGIVENDSIPEPQPDPDSKIDNNKPKPRKH